jgi:cyclophilin family peptidyl-prolyl cis-trans isomerase
MEGFMLIRLLAAVAALFALAASPQTQTAPATTPAQGKSAGRPAAAAPAEEEVAVIATDLGKIVIRFFSDSAPGHVDNFKALARAKFYDGTTFHRVVPGFVIQGGDPLTRNDDPNDDGTGDGPRQLKAEFNDRPHVRGALSMARSSDPNSASCQFFIVLDDAPNLDGKYSLFGEVIEGMDTVDKLVSGANIVDAGRGRPAKPVVMRTVRIEKRPHKG